MTPNGLFLSIGQKMKHIVLFGAGKSATALIRYFIENATHNHWHITISDQDVALASSKTVGHPHTTVVSVDAQREDERRPLIKSADIVISLLPPALHYLVACDCIQWGKHLLTASYIDDKIRSLADAASEKKILLLCEMGLDPGIDHMSAMKLINHIRLSGGRIHSFKSHCGGLVAPESDDNPWRYKVSWNPRNIVMAGKPGADFRENNNACHLNYEALFDGKRVVQIPELGPMSWYPNRDSLNYLSVYGLGEAGTFIRTTLRYPEFCYGWKNIIDLKLTDETLQYDTGAMTLQQFFQLHFNKYGFTEWIEKQLTSRFTQTKALLEKLQQLLDAEEAASTVVNKELLDFMMVDDTGKLQDLNLQNVKQHAAATVADTMHAANLAIRQLFFLGMNDDTTIINKGKCSAADVLQFALENKLALKDHDRDMIVMLHEIGYTFQGKNYEATSCLIEKGRDSRYTAMAKTVGLPLGIATKLILDGKLKLTGLHIPVVPEIYEPVLAELQKHGILFDEKIREV